MKLSEWLSEPTGWKFSLVLYLVFAGLAIIFVAGVIDS